ncbi:MAG: dienelactone hydrolase family protein, partial [Dehalococcoidia bacterium]
LQSVPLQDYVRANPMLSPVPPLMAAEALKAAYGGVRPDMSYDPVTDYERVRCPVLFLIGEKDRNLPAHEGATRVAEALKRAGNRDYTVKVLPNVEHALNVSYPRLQGMTTGEASMALHGFCFAPGYLSLMSNWILERVATATRTAP